MLTFVKASGKSFFVAAKSQLRHYFAFQFWTMLLGNKILGPIEHPYPENASVRPRLQTSSIILPSDPENDQNTIPTNQGSKLDRTSQLTFYGSRGHLKSFSGDFLV